MRTAIPTRIPAQACEPCSCSEVKDNKRLLFCHSTGPPEIKRDSFLPFTRIEERFSSRLWRNFNMERDCFLQFAVSPRPRETGNIIFFIRKCQEHTNQTMDTSSESHG